MSEAGIRVQDPVCGRPLDLMEAVAMSDHRGWAHFFCSEECRNAFEAAPDRYGAAPVVASRDGKPRR